MTWPGELWQVNGHLLGALPIKDRGLAYGDGLFETLLWQRSRQQGVCPFWPYHRARLLQGCQRLAIPLSPEQLDADYAAFVAQVSVHAEHLHSAVIKLIVTRGEGGRGYTPPRQPSPNSIWQLLPAPALGNEAEQGLILSLSDVRLGSQPLLAGLKHLNRLEYVLAAQRAPEGTQPLLLDAHDRVIETQSHNLFLVINGVLFTPALQHCGVKGVLREYLLQQNPLAQGYVLNEANISLGELLAAQEVFVGNSVRGFWPVTALHGMPQALVWPVGAVCRQLQQHHQQFLVTSSHV